MLLYIHNYLRLDKLSTDIYLFQTKLTVDLYLFANIYYYMKQKIMNK